MEFNLAELAAAVAAAVPDRECFVQGGTRLTFSSFVERSHRLANALVERGLGCHLERDALAGHESGQDQLAIYLYNGHEFLESIIGAFAARVAPFNVNYRYVDEELVYLLVDLQATAIVYHSAFAPALERIRPQLAHLRVLLQVDDASGHPLLDGAEWYEDVLATQPTSPPALERSPDDLYVLCTGGTTGMPKGVLWRQADVYVAALGGTDRAGVEHATVDEIVEQARAMDVRRRNMSVAPFMHGAAQWLALSSLFQGTTCVLAPHSTSLVPAEVWRTVERERVTLLQIIGDAFARPLLDELDRSSYDLSSLRFVFNSGAVLSTTAKQRLVDRLPHVRISDAIGTSEAGASGSSMSDANEVSTGVFEPNRNVRVLSEDRGRPLRPGDDELGWMAQTGRIPLGYLGDAAKTAATFPIVGGLRYVVAGDRARLRSDGRMEVHGRDAVTINSGGEKIFAEEVEQALLAHPAVADVVVCGRPSERWGSEVVAIVTLCDDAHVTTDDLLATASQRLARYKLPKAVLYRDHIVRSPAGKADYAWARAQAAGQM